MEDLLRHASHSRKQLLDFVPFSFKIGHICTLALMECETNVTDDATN